MEQRFHLEAAFREIDTCEDIEKLRELTKQIITAQENEKAFARFEVGLRGGAPRKKPFNPRRAPKQKEKKRRKATKQKTHIR